MSSTASRRSRHGNIRFLPLFALLLTFGSGVLLYRHFFYRSGEEATALIPADACMIATLDLNPAPDQVPLFTRIAHAMTEEKIAHPVEKAASASTNGSSFFDEIQPQLQTSYAAAMWANASITKTPPKSLDDLQNDLRYVVLATVKDPAQVGVISEKYGVKAEQNGLTYYQIRNEKFCVSVIRDYLIVADSPASLLRIQSVDQGKTPSLSSLATYQEARAQLPAEANLMVFGNMTEAAKSAEQRLTFVQKYTSRFKVAGWSIMAVTLRDRGIETVVKYPYTDSDPSAKVMSQIAPIDPQLYKRLPGNAYGFLIFAQPGRYYQVADAALQPESDERKTFEKGVADFEKETGLSISQDLMPGLIGNLALGVYPTSDRSAIPDGLIVLDDANGADSAAMIEKIKAVILKSSQDSHSTPPTFKSTERDGATIWTLDDESQKSLRHSTGMEDKTADPEKKREEKQLIFAAVGKTILIASSENMLDRAIATYTKGSESLASDPGYMPMLKEIPQGTQNLLLVDVPGVLEGMRPLIKDWTSDSKSVNVDDIVGFCGPRGTGLIAAQGYDGKMMSASLFIPIDYAKAVHTFGAANQASK